VYICIYSVIIFTICIIIIIYYSDGEDRGNPMVAGYMDELDPDDKEPPLPLPNTPGLLTSKDFTMSSDEEEVEAQPPPISPPVPAVTQDEHLDLDSDSELKK
jgi:hypothetical protein